MKHRRTITRALVEVEFIILFLFTLSGAAFALDVFSTGPSTQPMRVPEAIVQLPSGDFLVPDANLQLIWKVPQAGGTATVFSANLGINAIGGVLLPSNWGANAGKFLTTGFVPGVFKSKILIIDPGTGTFSVFLDKLSVTFADAIIAPSGFGTLAGNLLVADEQGKVWSVTPSGVTTQLAELTQSLPGFSAFGEAPQGFGSLGGTILVSAGTGGRIATVNAAGTVTPFVTLALGSGQIGLRQMAFSPPNFIPGFGTLLFVSVSGSQTGGGTLGDVLGLDSTGKPVVSLRSDLGLTQFDPRGLLFTGGKLLVSDSSTTTGRILRFSSQDFVAMTTVAGTGVAGFNADNIAAISAQLNGPFGVAVDSSGNLYIADSNNHRIRRVDATTKFITTVAGGGTPPDGLGDGGLATDANLSFPFGVAVASGNLYIADKNHHRIRKVDLTTGFITTVAGTGTPGFFPPGDGGPATSARLDSPTGVAVDGFGNLLIADSNSHRIRNVGPPDAFGIRIITTIAGTGMAGFPVNGIDATTANLWRPTGVAVDGNGNVYIADSINQQARKVGPPDAFGIRTITAVAGTVDSAGAGAAGFLGDGGAATAAKLSNPSGVAVVAVAGAVDVYIADAANERIRKVSGADGKITTVAGGGTPADGLGDGGPATSARLNNPTGVAATLGNIFIADYTNQRIRRVGP